MLTKVGFFAVILAFWKEFQGQRLNLLSARLEKNFEKEHNFGWLFCCNFGCFGKNFRDKG